MRIGKVRWRSRSRRGWLLLVVSVVLGGAVGAMSALWLPGPAAAAVGSTLAAAVFGAVSARAKVLIDGHSEYEATFPERLIGVGKKLRPGLVRDYDDPIALRVHPAETLQRTIDDVVVADQVPPYVSRDVQQQLWDAVAHRGFVLVVGDSTAGKTRIAYEAMRAVLADHALIAPVGREALPAAMSVASGQRRCVVWLDDLERFFGQNGLTAHMVSRILGRQDRHVVVIATLRSADFDRFSAREEYRLTGMERDSWREAHDILEIATIVELQRHWSTWELQRASKYDHDPRIFAALTKTGQFGLAEILAAGPQLARDWRNAWRAGANPRGAALVAAAVDCRRAGVHTAQPLDLLSDLAEHYLTDRGGPLLRPESLDEAVAWATTPSHGASSLLLPSDKPDHYLAFDYLIDLPGLDAVRHIAWTTLIDHASPQQAFEIGEVAWQRFQFNAATDAFRKAAEHDVPEADQAMAQMLGRWREDRQNLDSSVRLLTDAVARHERRSGSCSPSTLRARIRLAQRFADGIDPARAAELLVELVVDVERVFGPDHHDTLNTRRWHAFALGKIGDTRAMSLLEEALSDHERILGRDHHDTLLTRHYIAWLVSLSRPRESLDLLADIRADYERVLGPDSPRVLQVRSLMGRALGEAGEPKIAAEMMGDVARDRRRILGVRHPHTVLARFDMIYWTSLTGDRSGAARLFDDLLADWLHRSAALNEDFSDMAELIVREVAHHRPLTGGQARTMLFTRAWTCENVLGPEHALTREVRRLCDQLAREVAD